MKPFISLKFDHRVKRSLDAIVRGIDSTLESFKDFRDEIATLVSDFTKMRRILANHDWSMGRVKRAGKRWVTMLSKRLKLLGLEHDPTFLKRQRCGVTTKKEIIWQDWIRLHFTHEKGLYVSYDVKELGFTNNPKEILFGAGRHHYRKLFGRGNISKHFIANGVFYCKVRQLHLSEFHIKKILIGENCQMVKEGLERLHEYTKRSHRTWKIREIETGNFLELKRRLSLCIKK